jgi:SAM-dependent MidA family methyltransferase
VTAHPERPLEERIAGEIDRDGGITFARFMELALYDPDNGYYRAADRRPGRGGDFITAPELHPLFGLALSRHIAECWQTMDRPETFTIREYGAGVGGLAYDILAGLLDAHPELRDGLRYEMIEVNAHRREQAMRAMIEVGLDDVVTAHEVPGEEAIVGVVIANEVADALPVHRLVVRNGGLREAWVVHSGDTFGWEERDLSAPVADVPAYLTRQGVEIETLPEGSVIEVSPASRAWIAEIARSLRQGHTLVIDYGYPVAELLRDHRLQGTLRGYREHTVNDDPFRDIGDQDLTAHVDFSALIEAAEANGMQVTGLATQADFLERIGLGDLLVEMQQQEGMTLDVYYRAQMAVYRLIDPGGMGRFRVLGLHKDLAKDDVPRAFVERGLHL